MKLVRDEELGSDDSAAELDGKRQELLSNQLLLFVNLYKHHYDLFVKGYVVYLAIVGAVATIVFRKPPVLTTSAPVWCAIAISILSLGSCVNGLSWLGKLEKNIEAITKELDLQSIPLLESKVFVGVLGVVSVVIAVGFFFSRNFEIGSIVPVQVGPRPSLVSIGSGVVRHLDTLGLAEDVHMPSQEVIRTCQVDHRTIEPEHREPIHAE